MLPRINIRDDLLSWGFAWTHLFALLDARLPLITSHELTTNGPFRAQYTLKLYISLKPTGGING